MVNKTRIGHLFSLILPLARLFRITLEFKGSLRPGGLAQRLLFLLATFVTEQIPPKAVATLGAEP